MSPDNLLLNSYFENLTVKLHGLYVLNVYTYFYNNQMLFIIQSITSSLCIILNYKNLNLNN